MVPRDLPPKKILSVPKIFFHLGFLLIFFRTPDVPCYKVFLGSSFILGLPAGVLLGFALGLANGLGDPRLLLLLPALPGT